MTEDVKAFPPETISQAHDIGRDGLNRERPRVMQAISVTAAIEERAGKIRDKRIKETMVAQPAVYGN